MKKRLATGVVPALPTVVCRAEPWPTGIPLVSVVIPCYEQGEYLRQAIESVMQQTLQDFELIIVDDGSTDSRTRALLETLDHPKIMLLRQANQGPAAARNAGIANASGRYVCCLDADDYLAPDYLEKCVVLLEANRGVRLTYSWIKLVGDEARIVPTPDWSIDLLRYVNYLYVSAVFRRDDWLKAGGFRSGDHEDWDFWLHLATLGIRGKVIPEPLFFYRKHGESRCRDGNANLYRVFETLRMRYPAFYADKTLRRQIVQSYRDELCEDPMANLSRPEQYRSERYCLYVHLTDEAWPEDDAARANGMKVIVIVAEMAHLPQRWLDRAEGIYSLSALLNKLQWQAFYDGFIASRRVECLFSDQPPVK